MAKQKFSWLSLLLILTKSSKIIKVFSAFKVAKPLVTLVTMSISIFAYAFWLGPWFSVAIVLLIFVHEMGHVAAMRLKNFDTPTPVFIPFLGAAIFAPKFTDRNDEAFVGFGGPLLGSLAAITVFGIYLMVPRGSDVGTILLAASYAGIYLNLFNLLPISPLDGGRVTQAVGGWFKFIGLFLLAVLSITMREPVILLIWIFVLDSLDIIPIKIRVTLSITLMVAMSILMMLGYSNQPYWVDIIDCIVATMVVLFMFMKMSDPELDNQKDERPTLEKSVRLKWAGLYGSLALALLLIISIQAQYLQYQVS